MKSEQEKNTELLDQAYDLLWKVYAQHKEDDTFEVDCENEYHLGGGKTEISTDTVYAKVSDLLNIINKLDNLMGR